MAQNTAFEYMYRDGDNFKISNRVVFAGEITLEMRDRLQDQVIDEEDRSNDAYGFDGYFIPGIVGLKDLQDQFYVQELRVLETILSSEDGPTGDQRARIEELRDIMANTKPMWSDISDHIYHTIEHVSLTDAAPTETRSIAEFVEDMERASWSAEYLPPCFEEMHQNFLKAQDDPEFDGI